MKQTIWILSELYYPELSATGHYVTRVAEGLASSFSVRVLCAQPTYLSRGTLSPVREIRQRVEIRRCAGTTLDKDVISFRLLNLVTISASIFFNALFRVRRGDIVFVVTNPPTLPFLAAVACRLRRAKLILRIEDVYPEALYAGRIVRKDGDLVKILDILQRRLYGSAERIVVLGRDMERLIASKLHGETSRLICIPNWGDVGEIVPLPRQGNRLLQDLGLTEKFVVQYSGNMGRTHDIEGIVECARVLQGNSRIHFLFIGWGAKESWLRSAVASYALRNVTILPSQPRTDLVLSLNACDVALFAFVQGMCGVSVPSRVYNNLAAGKPIVAATDPDSDLALLVKEESLGWTVNVEEPFELAAAVQKAFDNRSCLGDMSIRARKIAEERFSEPLIQSRYNALFTELASSQQTGRTNVA